MQCFRHWSFIANMGNDSKKAKFPQSPLGEMLWKLHTEVLLDG